MRKLFPWLSIGYGYHSAIIVPEPGARPAGPGTTELRGRPGTRLPHVWLTRSDDSERVSSLDLVGPRWLLIAAPGGSAWREAAERAAAVGGVALHALQLGREVLPAPRQSMSVFGIGQRGALLVRPDGFIAWRVTAAAPSDSEANLRDALRRSVGQDLPPRAAAVSANLLPPHQRAHAAIPNHPRRRA